MTCPCSVIFYPCILLLFRKRCRGNGLEVIPYSPLGFTSGNGNGYGITLFPPGFTNGYGLATVFSLVFLLVLVVVVVWQCFYFAAQCGVYGVFDSQRHKRVLVCGARNIRVVA